MEIDPRLCEALRRQWDVHEGDFLAYRTDQRFDRVLMNPPFEEGQDRRHVQHAYELLKPGGRLVAVMSEGPFFRERRGDVAFRDWLKQVGGASTKLPKDAFRESGVGVQTRMVVINRPATAAR